MAQTMPALRRLAWIALLCACKPAAVAPPRQAAAPRNGATEGTGGAVLLRRSGGVELQRGNGGWSAASEGDRIFGADAVRTGADSEVEISVDGVRVNVLDRSELRVSRAEPGALRARIRGRVESVVEPGKGTIALQVQDGDVVASSSGGHFFVTADGQGAVAVGTLSGSVAVEGGGRKVEVRKDGRLIETLAPEKRIYNASGQSMTIAAIDTGLLGDRYVSLGEPVSADATNIHGPWGVRIYLKPFVDWIWLGAFLMALGGFIAVSDRRYRLALRTRAARVFGDAVGHAGAD